MVDFKNFYLNKDMKIIGVTTDTGELYSIKCGALVRERTDYIRFISVFEIVLNSKTSATLFYSDRPASTAQILFELSYPSEEDILAVLNSEPYHQPAKGIRASDLYSECYLRAVGHLAAKCLTEVKEIFVSENNNTIESIKRYAMAAQA